jgi:hypothetical protein
MALERARPRARANDSPARGRDSAPEQFTLPALARDRLFTDVMFVRPRPVTRGVAAPAWVESADLLVASVYHDEAALLETGEEGTFTLGHGGPAIAVRLERGPPVPWDAATSTVRLRAASAKLTTGTVGRVSFPARTRPMLAIPYSAVVQGGTGPYVLVASLDRHTFTRRPVEIGRVVFGYAPVLGGLSSGERIAVMETFFIDAERRLGTTGRRSSVEAAP